MLCLLRFYSTFFVEYVFPTASASSRHDRSKAADGDVTRAVSSKVTGGGMTRYNLHFCQSLYRFVTVSNIRYFVFFKW